MHGWQKAMDPWAEKYAELHGQLEEHCRSLTDAQLQAFGDAAIQPSETNCGWSTYEVAPMIRDAVKHEQYRRLQQQLNSGRKS